eukprot:6554779-Prymnesium_polylepis.1
MAHAAPVLLWVGEAELLRRGRQSSNQAIKPAVEPSSNQATYARLRALDKVAEPSSNQAIRQSSRLRALDK